MRFLGRVLACAVLAGVVQAREACSKDADCAGVNVRCIFKTCVPSLNLDSGGGAAEGGQTSGIDAGSLRLGGQRTLENTTTTTSKAALGPAPPNAAGPVPPATPIMSLSEARIGGEGENLVCTASQASLCDAGSTCSIVNG